LSGLSSLNLLYLQPSLNSIEPFPDRAHDRPRFDHGKG
jgi:hypothetical protein